MIYNTLGAGQPIRLAEAAPKVQEAISPSEATQSFGEFLKHAIDGVAEQEHAVHKVTDEFLLGKADVSQVMITSEQAHLSLQLTSQIRNKVIEAYQEIMRIQV